MNGRASDLGVVTGGAAVRAVLAAAVILAASAAVGQSVGRDTTAVAVEFLAAVPADSLAAAIAEAEIDSSRVAGAERAAAVVSQEAVDLWDTGINPTGAVLMTPLFPGWGQLYAGNSWRAALAFGAQMYFWTNLLSRERQAVRYRSFSETLDADDPNRRFYGALSEENWEQMRDFAWWSGGALLIIALDAYVGAHLFNFGRDPVPVPDHWDEAFGPVALGPPDGGDPMAVVVFQWRKRF